MVWIVVDVMLANKDTLDMNCSGCVDKCSSVCDHFKSGMTSFTTDGLHGNTQCTWFSSYKFRNYMLFIMQDQH